MRDTPKQRTGHDRDAAEGARETVDEAVESSPGAALLDESNPDPPEPSEPG